MGQKVNPHGMRVGVIKGIHEKLILHVQCSQSFLVKLDLFIGQTSGFFDGSIVAGESGEGGKLRRSIRHRHLRSRSGDVVREIDNLVVPIIHAHSVSHLLDKLEFSN